MSNRFHNKYHRHNHHTTGSQDPRYPDSAHDPIASPESPFLGPFVMIGTLSASGLPNFSSVPSGPGGDFSGDPIAIRASGTVALSATGDILSTGAVVASDIRFTGGTVTTFSDPVTATGEFLVLSVNGNRRLLRLWNY